LVSHSVAFSSISSVWQSSWFEECGWSRTTLPSVQSAVCGRVHGSRSAIGLAQRCLQFNQQRVAEFMVRGVRLVSHSVAFSSISSVWQSSWFEECDWSRTTLVALKGGRSCPCDATVCLSGASSLTVCRHQSCENTDRYTDDVAQHCHQESSETRKATLDHKP
jgi:hypothetical protein